MNIVTTSLPGVLLIEPRVFEDPRGYFLETWQQARYTTAGIAGVMVQDNVSRSTRGVLRGLHFQSPHPQAKLVYVLEGDIFDVAVDIRVGSPDFGKWTAARLSAENKRQMYIPEGFAHGFCVLSDIAVAAYKCTDFYRPACEIGIRWDDPELNIPWPVGMPLLSAKDAAYCCLREISEDRLPKYAQHASQTTAPPVRAAA